MNRSSLSSYPVLLAHRLRSAHSLIETEQVLDSRVFGDEPGAYRGGQQRGQAPDAPCGDAVVQRLMPALDLALGLGVVRCAANMVHALLGEPTREIAGDVVRSIVAEQTRPVCVSSTVEPLCLESHLQAALQPRF